MRTVICEVCSTPNQGFHLCTGMKPAALREHLFLSQYKKVERDPNANPKGDHVRARWAAVHAETAERDSEILRLKDEEGWSYSQIMEKFDLPKHSALKIVKRMREKANG